MNTNRARTFLGVFVVLATVMNTGCGRRTTIIQQVPQQTAGQVTDPSMVPGTTAVAGATDNTSTTGAAAVDPSQVAGLQGPVSANFNVTIIKVGRPGFGGGFGGFGGFGGGWRPWHRFGGGWGGGWRPGPLGRPVYVYNTNNYTVNNATATSNANAATAAGTASAQAGNATATAAGNATATSTNGGATASASGNAVASATT